MIEFPEVFHGSMRKGLTFLDPSKAGTGIVSGSPDGPVTWFSSSMRAAEYYADAPEFEDMPDYIYKARVRLGNPLVVSRGGEWEPGREHWGPASYARHARSLGHDGLVMMDESDGDPGVRSTIIAAFSSRAIKLIGSVRNSQ